MRLTILLTSFILFAFNIRASPEWFPFETLPEMSEYLSTILDKLELQDNVLDVFGPAIKREHTLLSQIIGATDSVGIADIADTISFKLFQKKLVFTIEAMDVFTTRVATSNDMIHRLLLDFETWILDAEIAWSAVLERSNKYSDVFIAYPSLLNFETRLIESSTFLVMYLQTYQVHMTPLETDFHQKQLEYIRKTLRIFNEGSNAYYSLISLPFLTIGVHIQALEQPMNWFDLGFQDKVNEGDEDSVWLYHVDLDYQCSEWNDAINAIA